MKTIQAFHGRPLPAYPAIQKQTPQRERRDTAASKPHELVNESQILPVPYLPCEAVALAVVKPKVAHLAFLDIHSSLSHVVLGPGLTRFAIVDDALRDDSDVRPTVVLVFVDRVDGGIP